MHEEKQKLLSLYFKMPLNYFFLETIPSLFYNHSFTFRLLFSICRWNVLWALIPLPSHEGDSLYRCTLPSTHTSIYTYLYSEASLSLSGLWIMCLLSVSCQSIHSSPVSHFSSVEGQNHHPHWQSSHSTKWKTYLFLFLYLIPSLFTFQWTWL